MLYGWILFAEEKVAEVPANADAPAKEGPGLLGSLMPIFMIVIVFYFLIILPGRKERQQRQSLMSALKRNDKVITNGGIIGVVTNIKEGTDEVTIKSEETKLLILRSSIARIITEPESSTQIKPTS